MFVHYFPLRCVEYKIHIHIALKLRTIIFGLQELFRIKFNSRYIAEQPDARTLHQPCTLDVFLISTILINFF